MSPPPRALWWLWEDSPQHPEGAGLPPSLAHRDTQVLSSDPMAPLPVITNVYRTALLWGNAAGGNPVNVLHFRGSPGSAAGLYTALDANVTSGMWAFTTTNLAINTVAITPLDGTTATVLNATGGPAKWAGSTVGDSVPAAAPVLSFRTAKRGPSYRGRIYLPGLVENGQTDGVLQGATKALLLAAWVTFRTAIAAAGYPLVVASYVHSTAELVTSQDMNSRYGIVRRRQSL